MEFPRQIPFVKTLGFELLKFEGGEAEIAVEVRDELCNSWMVAHGGLTMTLLDVAWPTRPVRRSRARNPRGRAWSPSR